MERFDVLVVGGGIAGLTVASALEGTASVLVLEEKEFLGGLARELSCKATNRCLRCGVCRAVEVLRKASFGIHSITGESLESVSWGKGVFHVATNHRAFAVRSVVLATGAVPFRVEEFPRYLWGRKRRIFTGFELEKKLKSGNLEDFASFSSCAFVQCVGSRSSKERRGYCSQVCCRYALRLVENLRFRFPETSCDLYYMDLQIFGDGEKDLRTIASSVSLFRSLPFALEEDALGVTVWVEIEGKVVKRRYDAVVLSVGLVPSSGTRRAGELFRLPQKEGGFLVPRPEDGIFACGTATGPKDIVSTIGEAERLAEDLLRFLGG
ncbi:MAG: FAD-dependent oxidoreductase [Atribacterota bacterium]